MRAVQSLNYTEKHQQVLEVDFSFICILRAVWCINKMGRALKINACSWPTTGCLFIIEALLYTLKVCLNDRKFNVGQDSFLLQSVVYFWQYILYIFLYYWFITAPRSTA